MHPNTGLICEAVYVYPWQVLCYVSITVVFVSTGSMHAGDTLLGRGHRDERASRLGVVGLRVLVGESECAPGRELGESVPPDCLSPEAGSK